MSMRYPGGVISATPPTISQPSTAKGVWTLQTQLQNAGNWPFPVVAPVNTVLPVVSGTALVGQTLSTTNGTWTGTTPITFTYQWQRVTTNISGATSSTYVLVAADAGNTIRCVVTATNAADAVSASSADTAVVVNPQRLYSWGLNNNGQLGLNNTVNRSSPVQIGALTTWSQVAAGSDLGAGAYHSLAIKTDGTMWSWGRNNFGQLGINNVANRSSPVQVGALTTWAQVAAGGTFSLAIETDGSLYAWGRNNAGQLGLNNVANRSSPVQIGALTTWSQIAAGAVHSLAIKTDGTMWSWGAAGSGQLGNNNVSDHSSPVQIGALTTWSKVAGGNNHSLAIKTDGTMWSWGTGNLGALGLNDASNRSSPVQIGALTTWSQIAAAYNFSLAIKTDGTMWSWGSGNLGALGLNDNGINRSSPVQIGALTTWSQVAGGDGFGLAIKTDGTMWSWGYNAQGQLGLNNDIRRSSPVQIGALTTWAQLPKMPTARHSIAITAG